MAETTFVYCTQTDVKNVYNDIDNFDSKQPIHNWEIDDNYGYAYNTGNVTRLYADGKDLGARQGSSGAVDAAGEWYYDSSADKVWYYFGSSNTSPNDMIMEHGAVFSDYIVDRIEEASMQLNSMLDHSRFPIPIPKSVVNDDTANQSGTPQYDYVIIRLTALLTAYNCIVARDPQSEDAIGIMAQISNENEDGLLDRLNAGTISLNFETDRGDSTQGKILEIVKTGSMRLVEATCPEGFYGEAYERVQILCTSAGAYGVAEVSVKVTGNHSLYGSTIQTGLKITGGLQHITQGLYCRFEGASLSVHDRFDVEVRNRTLKTTSGSIKSVDILRGKRWETER